jgi:hypothetical protein
MTAPSTQQREGNIASRLVAAEAIASSPSLPSRTEFGHDHYAYVDGQRMRVGATRTLRPSDGETGASFRHRVDDLAQQLLLCGTLSVDEEIRSGVVVQAILRLQFAPEPAPILDDSRLAGGRPSGPRGKRGGS